MSCSTVNSQPTALTVSMGSLPEGFCGTPQQLANAIAARLIVQISQNNGIFVTGSTAPTSNQGPWLKNCEEWWVWSDSLASYVPLTKGGYTLRELLTTTGNFIVPAFIYRLRISAWGGGGGGSNSTTGSSAGGGGGGFCSYDVAVTPGQVIPYVIGAGGAAGTTGVSGGNTTILALTAGGGVGGTGASPSNLGGLGGSATGGTLNFLGQSGFSGVSANGGAGGDSPQGGGGGAYDVTNRAAVINGVFPGGGGNGATSTTGLGAGSGANGCICVEY